jgi:hypothetical protein
MTTSLDSTMKPLDRDRLFFDQYRYSMRFRFRNSGRMRVLTHEAINQSVDLASMMARLNPKISVSDDTKHRLLAMCDLLNSITVPHKRIVYSDWQYFYTNDPEFFVQLEQFPGVDYVNYFEANLIKLRDTVMLKESAFKWRTYFKDRFYQEDQTATFINFLLSRPQQFRVTDLQRRRMQNNKYFYITRSMFVDHHDQRDALLLNLAVPGCVRKTLPIVVAQ